MLSVQNLTLEALAQAPFLVEELKQRIASGAADPSAMSPAFQAVLAPSDSVFADKHTQATAQIEQKLTKTSARIEVPVEQYEDGASAKQTALLSKAVKKPVHVESEHSAAAAFQEYLDTSPQHKLKIQNAVETLVNMFSGISEAQAQTWYRNISATYGGAPLTAAQVTTIVEQSAKDVEAVLQMVLDVKNDSTTSLAAQKEADEFLSLHREAMLGGSLVIQNTLLERQMLIVHTDVKFIDIASPTPVASAVLSEADALQKAGVKSVAQLTVKLANQTVQNAQATGLMSASQLIALRQTYRRLVAKAALHEAEMEHAPCA